MDESILNRKAEYLRIIFQILWGMPEGLPSREVMGLLAEQLDPSEVENVPAEALVPPQHELLAREVTGTLVESGWFIKARERWLISDEGRIISRSLKDMKEMYKSALLISEQRQKKRAEILLANEDMQDRAWQQMWRYANEMNAVEFKRLVAELFLAMEYEVDWLAPAGRRRGMVDMVIYKKEGTEHGPRIKVHVHHHGQPGTVEGLRAFLEEISASDLGIYISSGGFTEQVLEGAYQQEIRKLRLITLDQIIEMWQENYPRLTDEARRHFPLKSIYFLAPIG